MQIKITVVLLSFLIFTSCKTQPSKTDSTQIADASKTIGIVSHKYNVTGCATVIIVNQTNEEELVLIPSKPLEKNIDADGLEINFNYRMLKMPNPKGCNVGVPAEITNVSKK